MQPVVAVLQQLGLSRPDICKVLVYNNRHDGGYKQIANWREQTCYLSPPLSQPLCML